MDTIGGWVMIGLVACLGVSLVPMAIRCIDYCTDAVVRWVVFGHM